MSEVYSNRKCVEDERWLVSSETRFGVFSHISDVGQSIQLLRRAFVYLEGLWQPAPSLTFGLRKETSE